MILKYFAEGLCDKFLRETYFPDFDYRGTMVEVGGATPDFISMSKHFKINGWRTIIIEPIPEFVTEHIHVGNEVYEYAAASENKDGVPFSVVNWVNRVDCPITYHSLSSLGVKVEYLNKDGYNNINDLLNHDYHVNKNSNRKPEIKEIRVNCRTLDYILQKAYVNHVDIISIDVEGYELDVLSGFNIQRYKPSVFIIENYTNSIDYVDYMNNVGYKLAHQISHNQIFIMK